MTVKGGPKVEEATGKGIRVNLPSILSFAANKAHLTQNYKFDIAIALCYLQKIGQRALELNDKEMLELLCGVSVIKKGRVAISKSKNSGKVACQNDNLKGGHNV